MAPSYDRPIPIAGLRELPRLIRLIIGAQVLMLATVTVLLYLDARALAPEQRLEKLAGGGIGAIDLTFAALMLTVFGLLLRYRQFDAPDLDLMLVSPLTEERIFWIDFKRLLWPIMVVGAATCLPSWGHLLGLGAGVWLYLATAALRLCSLVLLLATAELLALAGGLVCLLPFATALGWSLWTGEASFRVRMAAPASAATWHPVAFSLVVVAVACVLMLGLVHLLVRRCYSRDALISRRDQPPSWWQRSDRPSSEEHDRPTNGSGSGGWLVRRLGRKAHGLWRLAQRDEQPEAFARRIPQAMVCGAVWLAGAHWKLGSGTEPSEDVVAMLGAVFLFVWVMGLAPLAAPSGLPLTSGGAAAQPSMMLHQPLHEIFPVGPRAYAAAVFCCGSFLITLSLLLLVPFVLLAPLPAGSVLRPLATLWVVAELGLGLIMFQLSPRLDPRRPGLSWWRVLRVLAFIATGVASVVALIWLCGSVLIGSEWLPGAFGELIHEHPAASAGFAALIFALLELLVILGSLRRHEKRWFDAAW